MIAMRQMITRLDDDLHEALKRKAKAEGKSLNALVVETLSGSIGPEDAQAALVEELRAKGWLSEHEPPDGPIPTLEDVIRLVKGKLRLNIELKTHGKEQGFEASVAKLIHDLAFREECVITSLDQAALQAVRAADPTLRIGMIITAMVGDEGALDVDFYSVQPLIATVPFIRRAHRRGREVHVWTVNDREAMTRFADRGVDNLITDHPRLAREVLDERDWGDEVGAALTRLFRH